MTISTSLPCLPNARAGNDVYPENEVQVNFTIFTLAVGIFIHSVIIGSVGVIVRDLDHVASIRKEHLDKINDFREKISCCH